MRTQFPALFLTLAVLIAPACGDGELPLCAPYLMRAGGCVDVPELGTSGGEEPEPPPAEKDPCELAHLATWSACHVKLDPHTPACFDAAAAELAVCDPIEPGVCDTVPSMWGTFTWCDGVQALCVDGSCCNVCGDCVDAGEPFLPPAC